MAEDTDKDDDINQKLDKICENQQVITNYLNTLNQFIMYSHFNVTEQFSDTLSALQFGSSLMNERLGSIKSENLKSNNITERKIKKVNPFNEYGVSDIFSKFPHSSLSTPPSFSGSSNGQKGTVESSPVSSSSSLTEFYDNLAKAPGPKAFNRNFRVKEVSDTSISENGSAPSSQSLNKCDITKGKRKVQMPPLTPVPVDNSARFRRAAAPSTLKEPSLKKKMRRT
uniref:Uncharacterized protein n=1 Tax=Panagrolaimus sp. ES5 TaxID=591445 RepID=A0AC34FB36_9BILA